MESSEAPCWSWSRERPSVTITAHRYHSAAHYPHPRSHLLQMLRSRSLSTHPRHLQRTCQTYASLPPLRPSSMVCRASQRREFFHSTDCAQCGHVGRRMERNIELVTPLNPSQVWRFLLSGLIPRLASYNTSPHTWER